MNPWNELYARVVWPATDRSYRGLRAHMRRYQEMEGWTPSEAAEAGFQALRRIVRHAYETSPFYHERFDRAGFHPEAMSSPEALQVVPPLTRADLRQHGAELCSRAFDAAELQPASSGGTTDTPVRIWRDPESLRAKHAMLDTLNLWAGLRPGDKVFLLWGARSDCPEHPSLRWRLYEQWVRRVRWAPASYFTPDILEDYRRQCLSFRPRILKGYPTPMALWAEYLLGCGRDYHRPRAIVVTAEKLLAEQRQVIERAFECPVQEQYGSREFGMIAGQCERQGGMHLHPLAAHVEFRPLEDGSGLRELLVTDLLGYGMPLIRYQINDCASGEAQPCACGRPFPVLPPITGRSADVLRLPDGAVIPGVAFNGRILAVCPQIARMQVVQETLRDFRFRYVPGPGFEQGGEAAIRAGIERFFPGGLNWTLERVAEIPREASGKTRFVISRVAAASH